MSFLKKNVYIVSGPAGVGKSTTSKELVKRLCRSAYISGDYISHMHVNGRKKPWESKEERALIWSNILSLTQNFLDVECDVVIDYVTFQSEAKWLKDMLKDPHVSIKFIVLWADKETLSVRDNLRQPEHRMGERCLILRNEFKNAGIKEKNYLDNSKLTTTDIPEVINKILNRDDYNLI